MIKLLFFSCFLFCSPLLRAQGGPWINSKNLTHSIQLPQGWPAVTLDPEHVDTDLTHIFTLKSRSGELVVRIEYDAEQPSASDKIKRDMVVLSVALDNARLERFSPATGCKLELYSSSEMVNGVPRYRGNGRLTLPAQEFRVYFESSRSRIRRKDWEAALGALASLRFSPSTTSGDYREVAPGVARNEGKAPLAQVPASFPDGRPVKFKEIVIFACSNIPNYRYLFNQARTRHCLIKNPDDYSAITKALGGVYWGERTVFFSACPDEMAYEKHCELPELRAF